MIPHLANLDYLAVGVYVLLMALIGVVGGRFVSDVGSYLKGNSGIPWVIAATGNFMALFSTFVFVAYAGIAYEDGLVAVTVYWVTVPACILGAVIFAARWRRTGHTTPTEYLEARYGLGLRQVITWSGLLMRYLDNTIRLYAIGVFIAAATPLGLEGAILAAGLICATFNLAGGVWSVAVMSTVQFVILLLVCLILVPLCLAEIGSVGVLYEKIPQNMEWFNGPKGSLFWIFVYGYMIFVKFNENWTFIQRYYCVRDERAALSVGVLTGMLFFLCMPIFLFPAVASRVILPGLSDPEMSYVALSLKLLPAGVMGIMFSSMFAATMSTLNAEFNTMAAVLVTDVYKRLVNPAASDRRLLWLARTFTALVGAAVIGGALVIRHFGGAFEANKLFTGILAIPIGIPLLLGLLFRSPNAMSSTLTILGGIAAGIVLNMAPILSWEAATLTETVLCLAIYFSPMVLRRASDPATRQRVAAFFARIETPLREDEKPAISAQATRAVAQLFVLSLVIAGGLFIVMSLPSIRQESGLLSLAAGVVCLMGAGAIWLIWVRAAATPRV